MLSLSYFDRIERKTKERVIRLNLLAPKTISEGIICLRPIEAGDANLIFALRTCDEVIAYTGINKMQDMSEATTFIHRRIENMNAREAYFYVVELASEKKAIGTLCLWQIDKEKASAHIGYELLPEFQGRGYMHSACRALLSHSFDYLGFLAIWAEIHRNNTASIRLVEKLGFALDSREGSFDLYVLKLSRMAGV